MDGVETTVMDGGGDHGNGRGDHGNAWGGGGVRAQ